MRRTSTLRLLVIDHSALARNMYELLFRNLPGYQLEFADSAEGLTDRQRRARPHVVIMNSNALTHVTENAAAFAFVAEYPTLLLNAPDRLDLKMLAREHDKVHLVEKPFYPYDLITEINRIAARYHPLSGAMEPAPAPKKRRMRRSGKEH